MKKTGKWTAVFAALGAIVAGGAVVAGKLLATAARNTEITHDDITENNLDSICPTGEEETKAEETEPDPQPEEKEG